MRYLSGIFYFLHTCFVLTVTSFMSVFTLEFTHFACRKECFSCYVAYRTTELDLPYPDLQEYIADMNVMMALIINGPV